MKTLVKPLIRVHLEKPAAGMPGPIGIVDSDTAETQADPGLNGYRMLLHCQGASPDPGASRRDPVTPHQDIKQKRFDHQVTAATTNRNTTPQGR